MRQLTSSSKPIQKTEEKSIEISRQRPVKTVEERDDRKTNLNTLPVTRSFWSSVNKTKQENAEILYIMRSAERVDRVFGTDWMSKEVPFGQLASTDLNMPTKAIKNLLKMNYLQNDPPITQLGKYTSQLIARAMQNKGIIPSVIHCSPALRCVQTASAIANYLQIKVAIEPGLLEPGMNYDSCRLDVLKSQFPVDNTYTPIVLEVKGEIVGKAISRVHSVTRTLTTQPRKSPLFIVGHASTLDLAFRMANGDNYSENIDSSENSSCGTTGNDLELGIRYPPGCVMAMKQSNNISPSTYHIVEGEPIIPPLTFGNFYSSGPVFNHK